MDSTFTVFVSTENTKDAKVALVTNKMKMALIRMQNALMLRVDVSIAPAIIKTNNVL